MTLHLLEPAKDKEIKRIIEALLFSSSEPLSLEKMHAIIKTTYSLKRHELKDLVYELREEYRHERRGWQIDEIAHGFLLRTVEEVYPYVELLHQNRPKERLSKAAMEVLAIVAHRQPVTRAHIEVIRGVDSSGTLSSLVERGLIEQVGHLEAPGRPCQYGVTARFLQHFGLKDREEIPIPATVNSASVVD